MKRHLLGLTAVVVSVAGCGGGGGGDGGDVREEPSSELRSGPLLYSNVAFPPRDAYNLFADFDEDGLEDIVILPVDMFQSSETTGVYFRPGSPSELFGDIQTVSDSLVANDGAVIADFDGDTHLDLALGRGSLVMLPGNGDGTFAPATTIDALTGNPSIRTPRGADINGDGDQDIVGMVTRVPAPGAPFIASYLGDGTGGFTRVTTDVTDGMSLVGEPADFDLDGNLDVVVYADTVSPAYYAYFGVGDGTFGAPVALASITMPLKGVTGDVNGDSKPDFIAAGASDQLKFEYRVSLGAGDGTFTVLPIQTLLGTVAISLGSGTLQLVDLTSDGMPDLQVSLPGVEQMYCEGNGDGTFNDAFVMATTEASNAIVHDFTGDSIVDVYAGVLIPGSLGGVLNTLPSYPVGAAAAMVTMGLDGDAFDDVVVIDHEVRTLVSNGDNTFTETSSSPVPAGSLFIGDTNAYLGDFDNDSELDLAVRYGAFDADVAVLLNQGDTTLAPSAVIGFGGSGNDHYTELSPPADLDGDGNLDLFGRDRAYASLLVVSSSAIWVAFGNGDGTFQAPVNAFTDFSTVPTSADLDNDGLRSLVFHDTDDELVRILHTQSNRTFTAGATLAGTDDETTNPITVGRLDADSLDDLVVMGVDGDVSIYYGNTSNGVDTGQTFTFPVHLSGNSNRTRIIDSGTPRILVTHHISREPLEFHAELTVLERTASRTFAVNSAVQGHAGVGDFTRIADLNADGELDLLSPWGDMFEIFRGDSGGGFLPPLYFDLTTGSTSDVVALGDWDGDADIDVVVADNGALVYGNNQWFN